MTLPTFTPPVPPSPGTTNKPEFRVLSAGFGDSYSQDAPDGINNVRKVLSLAWDTLLPIQAKAITDFLEATRGAGIFYYTPSNEAVPIKWTCREFSDRRGEAGMRTVSATFRQSFNLAT